MNFKKLVIAGTIGCAAISFPLIFAACGDDSSSNSSEQSGDDMGVPVFESIDALKKEKCNSENEFKTVYVKADSIFYKCYKNKWSNSLSIELETVESKDDLDECNKENEGQMFRVPRDTIFDTYVCENGEWVSDFGGSSSKVVDPKTVVKGSFTDERDGKTYKTVQIGKQTWMAENLNYDDTKKTPKLAGRIWCNWDNCTKYGRYYNYFAALEACPSGWHLPSRDEFLTLIENVGGVGNVARALKSTSGWVEYDKGKDGNGEDLYGFNALPAGNMLFDISFLEGKTAIFWSSTKAYYGESRDLSVFYDNRGGVYSINGDFRVSVRCLKN